MSYLHEVSAQVSLVDHHCHGLMRDDLTRPEFELLASESDWPEPHNHTIFDSPVGTIIRAECAPLLGLPRHSSADDYWSRRAELGQAEVSRILMTQTGIGRLMIDTGFRSPTILSPDQMTELTGAANDEIVRIEQVAEQVVIDGTTAATFADDFRTALAVRAERAIGFKTIIAYRYGLDFDPDRPSDAEVVAAAGEWLSNIGEGRVRIAHPVLLRHLLWTAVDFAMPIQFHVGYGDSDITMPRCDPTQMTEFLRRTVDSGIEVMLLHCYPFIREAGFLAQVYPHVWLDNGAALNYTGPSYMSLMRQLVEMAPFSKVMFSSDAFGLPELYYNGSLLWRRGLATIFTEWVDNDYVSQDDAARYLDMMGRTNALRAYRLMED